jgi:hypothetical protein
MDGRRSVTDLAWRCFVRVQQEMHWIPAWGKVGQKRRRLFLTAGLSRCQLLYVYVHGACLLEECCIGKGLRQW